jgi:peptide/nickel transport system substrate-binding protein
MKFSRGTKVHTLCQEAAPGRTTMAEFDITMEKAKALAGIGKMSRRDFVRFAIGAGVTVPMAQAMFSTAARANPKKGGHFRAAIGHGQTSDSFDPATFINDFMFCASKSILGAHLVRIDPENNYVPYLAESIEPVGGASKWAFKLRKGVEFHNGKTLTPDDVIATINYHVGPDSKSPFKASLASIQSVKDDGSNIVLFELKGADADFPYVFSDYHINILPSKDGKVTWEGGVGAGPYVLKHFEPGVSISAERFPNYFGESWFDSVEMLSVVDVAARTNAYLTGEVHYIDRVDLKTVDMLKSAPETEIYNVSGFGHYNAPMQADVKPFDNADVRTALKYAFDRQEIVDKILFGYGIPGNDNCIAPSLKFAINPEPVHHYDPEKAKFHLKKAGLENLKVDFSTSDAAFTGAVDAALLMQDKARAAGIEINVVKEPSDGYWDNVYLKKPWYMAYWTGRPTIDLLVKITMVPGAPYNESHFNSPRLTELLDSARAEIDDSKRATMYAEVQQIMHDESGNIVLLFNNNVGALSTKIGHGKFNSDFDKDGFYMFDRWWMADA